MERSGRPPDVVYQGEQLDVRTGDTIVRGQLQHFEWVGRPQVVLAVPFTHDGRLVLVHQYRSATDGYTLELPAGKVADEDPDENLSQALDRELREEAGYALATAEYLGTLLTAPHFSDETIHAYTTHGEIFSAPRPTPKEQLTVELVPPADIDDLIRSGELTDAKSLAGLLLHQLKGEAVHESDRS